MKKFKDIYKGLILCLIISIPSWYIGKQFPIIGGVVIAIIAGMIITLLLKDKTKFEKGIKFTSKKYYNVQLHFLDLFLILM